MTANWAVRAVSGENGGVRESPIPVAVRPDAAAKRSLIVLIVLTVLVHMVFNGSRITISLYALRLGAAPATVGMLLGLFGALPMLLSVTTGRVIDRIGVRRPMITGALMASAGALSVPLFPGLAVLFVAAVLIGAGFMLFQIAQQDAAGYIGRPDQRAMNFSLTALGFSASNLLGPLLAGTLIDQIGPVWTFAAIGWLPLVTAACLARGIPDLPALPASLTTERRRLGELLAHGELRFIFLSTGLVAMAWDLYGFVMPIYGSHIGLSATRIGVVISMFALATFLVRLVMPLILHRMNAWQMLRLALAVSALVYFLFPFTSQTSLLMVLSFVLGFGLGSAQPMVMALLHAKTPEGRVGEAVGLRSMLINTSQTGLPLMFGVLGSALGMTPVFWTLAALQFIGCELIRRHQKHERAAR